MFEEIKELNKLVHIEDFKNIKSFLDKKNNLELFYAALELSINHNFDKCSDFILSKDLDFSSCNAIVICIISDNLTYLKRLLDDNRFDPNIQRGSAFYHSTMYNREESTMLLLSNERVDPTIRFNGGLINLIDNRQFDIVKSIIKNYDVDCSQPNQELIMAAARKDDLELIELILSDQRVDPSFDNNASVKMSTFGHNVNIVCAFLRHPSVNVSEVYQQLYEEYGEDGVDIINKSKIKLRDEIIDGILR